MREWHYNIGVLAMGRLRFYVVLLTYLLIIVFGILGIMGNGYHVGITEGLSSVYIITTSCCYDSI